MAEVTGSNPVEPTNPEWTMNDSDVLMRIYCMLNAKRLQTCDDLNPLESDIHKLLHNHMGGCNCEDNQMKTQDARSD